MFPDTARDCAKSITNWAWALSVFATQQGWNVFAAQELQEATAAFDQVNKSMECACANSKRSPRRQSEPTLAVHGAKPRRMRVEHFPGESHCQMVGAQ